MRQKVLQLTMADMGAKVSRIETLDHEEAGIPEMWQLPQSDTRPRLLISYYFFKLPELGEYL